MGAIGVNRRIISGQKPTRCCQGKRNETSAKCQPFITHTKIDLKFSNK